ncbi:MAG TPA: hypothetical protein VM677_22760 [Actinokineospora sp.]|nr:hypothetical protein [Actinokineospora sp.]
MGAPGCLPGSAPEPLLSSAPVAERTSRSRGSLSHPGVLRAGSARVLWLAGYQPTGPRPHSFPAEPFFPPIVDTPYGLSLETDQVRLGVPARTSSW